ncbi:MAG: MazG family protein [Chloroflexota bacterium]|nr:MazG family protein [Chloroflexota bacterium]
MTAGTTITGGTITVVGLGPGNPDDRTVGVQRALDRAWRIVLRTAVHPGIADLVADPRVTTCDDLYEAGASFDDVYARIADRVIDLARAGDVVFAVPGHPSYGERSVRLTVERAVHSGVPVTLSNAVSAPDALALATGGDPLAEGLQFLDGVDLAALLDAGPFGTGRVTIDPFRPSLVSQVYSAPVAAAVKLTLMAWFPDDHPLTVVRAAGVPGEEWVATVPLHALDRTKVDHLTSVRVPPIDFPHAGPHWPILTRIVARLRDEGGCPWDRNQTRDSLRSALLAEAYEVVDAIDSTDLDNLQEELGDLLLVICMQAQIADEAGEFDIGDVLDTITAKLIRRHPHVFGDRVADSAESALRTWQSVKREERQSNGRPPDERSPLDRLPRSMPALEKIARLAGDIAPPHGHAAGDDPGDALLRAALACVAAGEDPEAALGRALRRRVGPTASSTVQMPLVTRSSVTP